MSKQTTKSQLQTWAERTCFTSVLNTLLWAMPAESGWVWVLRTLVMIANLLSFRQMLRAALVTVKTRIGAKLGTLALRLDWTPPTPVKSPAARKPATKPTP